MKSWADGEALPSEALDKEDHHLQVENRLSV
jgi:hypothetical protein